MRLFVHGADVVLAAIGRLLTLQPWAMPLPSFGCHTSGLSRYTNYVNLTSECTYMDI